MGLCNSSTDTSQIRRYADVVVHKQLLAAISSTYRESETNTIERVDVGSLEALPGSTFVSILAGEGIVDATQDTSSSDALVDMLTAGASEMVLRERATFDTKATVTSARENAEINDSSPYTGTKVNEICEILNLHNRLAKQASFECQSLFLSLYFKDHEVETSGVVTDVRENGFFVYVPRFDLRGPVYVRDSRGFVQIDPALLELPTDAGSPPTAGFKEPARLFSAAVSTLHPSSGKLEVVLNNRVAYSVSPMDVVTIRLACEDWDVRARIPQPRLHLIAGTETCTPTTRLVVDSTQLQPIRSCATSKPSSHSGPSQMNVFSVISDLNTPPLLTAEDTGQGRKSKPQAPQIGRAEEFSGRIVYGNFVNPDTKSAKQQAAQTNAVEWRARARDMDSATAASVERSITQRQQRLAAGKRNTKIMKRK